VELVPDVEDEVSHVSPVSSVQVPLTHWSQVSMPLAFGHRSQLSQSPSVQPPPEVVEFVPEDDVVLPLDVVLPVEVAPLDVVDEFPPIPDVDDPI
jgi:hypothetical protein